MISQRALLLFILALPGSFSTHPPWAVEKTSSKVLLLVKPIQMSHLNTHALSHFLCFFAQQAAGRSGSTFVGEMLNQARNSFYLYEPCRSLEGSAGVARFSVRDVVVVVARGLADVSSCSTPCILHGECSSLLLLLLLLKRVSRT
jgi:hypothetical protein